MRKGSILVLCFVPTVLGGSWQDPTRSIGPLQQQLAAEDLRALAQAARELGDATRGAILFHQPQLLCTKCHATGDPYPTAAPPKDAAPGEGVAGIAPGGGAAKLLGPDLATIGREVTGEHLVESLLAPSKVIRKGYEAVAIATRQGLTLTGILVEDRADAVVIRDVSQDAKLVTIAKDDIEERNDKVGSIMPEGQVDQLGSRQEFLDLVRYLMEIAEHGPERARALWPAMALAPVLPDYERNIDHAGMIADLGRESFQRGEAIYKRLCINCHGTKDEPGSLPRSLRFASGKFKNGNDPYRMYLTLTHGFGMMPPQTWMVPEQKYDVIHYVREAYLKPFNPTQYVAVDDAYVSGVPKGATRGPKPSSVEPWLIMDCGPHLTATYEVPPASSFRSSASERTPADAPRPGERRGASAQERSHAERGNEGLNGQAGSLSHNIAYKGIAIRLDARPGGVSRGRHWMIFDHDTLRVAGAWSGEGFIDWNGINFNGLQQVHPRTVGQVQFANPQGPGWANPTDERVDDPRLRGRDGRRYGPLPREWARYRGMYHYANQVIVSYTVGDTPVLEMPGLAGASAQPVFTRTLHMGPRAKDLVLQVAHQPGDHAKLRLVPASSGDQAGPAAAVLEQVTRGGSPSHEQSVVVAGLSHRVPGAQWLASPDGHLRLKIPAGRETVKFVLWLGNVDKASDAQALIGSLDSKQPVLDLCLLTHGGPRRWPEILSTQAVIGPDSGPFAVDVLTHPATNPWFCQMRLSGFDFFPDGDRAAVCTWDGDVWLVSGLSVDRTLRVRGDGTRSAGSPTPSTVRRPSCSG